MNGAVRDETLIQLKVPTMFVQVTDTSEIIFFINAP
jgi:hypothetical protein